jgi:hypothetical protein
MMFALGMYTESMSIDVVVWYSDFRIGVWGRGSHEILFE